MVRTGDGFSTCKEHGGSYAGDLAAFAHLEDEHPALLAQLSRARVVPLAEGDDPADVIARQEPNRAARRRAARHAR